MIWQSHVDACAVTSCPSCPNMVNHLNGGSSEGTGCLQAVASFLHACVLELITGSCDAIDVFLFKKRKRERNRSSCGFVPLQEPQHSAFDIVVKTQGAKKTKQQNPKTLICTPARFHPFSSDLSLFLPVTSLLPTLVVAVVFSVAASLVEPRALCLSSLRGGSWQRRLCTSHSLPHTV